MRRRSGSPARRVPAAALDELMSETVSLFHRLRHAAEQVHRQGGVSAGRRGILRSLARGGPQTVPQLARARPVSRQLVQTLVNGLHRDGYVGLAHNPEHRRSHLVRLTGAGRRFVAQMERRERALFGAPWSGPSQRELEQAAATLRAVRGFFESEAWQRRLRDARPGGGER